MVVFFLIVMLVFRGVLRMWCEGFDTFMRFATWNVCRKMIWNDVMLPKWSPSNKALIVEYQRNCHCGCVVLSYQKTDIGSTQTSGLISTLLLYPLLDTLDFFPMSSGCYLLGMKPRTTTEKRRFHGYNWLPRQLQWQLQRFQVALAQRKSLSGCNQTESWQGFRGQSRGVAFHRVFVGVAVRGA